jgi:hypothetical protein
MHGGLEGRPYLVGDVLANAGGEARRQQLQSGADRLGGELERCAANADYVEARLRGADLGSIDVGRIDRRAHGCDIERRRIDGLGWTIATDASTTAVGGFRFRGEGQDPLEQRQYHLKPAEGTISLGRPVNSW